MVLIPDSMLRKWFKINSVVGDREEVATAAPYRYRCLGLALATSALPTLGGGATRVNGWPH
jgi:hypothetical protein